MKPFIFYVYLTETRTTPMTPTFAEIISQSQKAIASMMEGKEYNPISVICTEVASITSDLSTAALSALVAERPTILEHKPTDQYYLGNRPTGEQVIRACVQMEVETEIDMTPFADTVRKCSDSFYNPPEHLDAKMQAILQAA
jgi:hypothetical protein